MSLTAIILTYNAEGQVEEAIASCADVADRLFVVDSGSTDGTVRLVRRLGCEVLLHPFETYALQRNWAQAQAGLAPTDWVLHVDADERLSPELHDEIRAVTRTPRADVAGYLVRRVTYFWGAPIRYGHMNPSWHLRLFQAGAGRCEQKLYDQHFVCDGSTRRLKGCLLDVQPVDLDRWTSAHNRWSTLEAQQAGLSPDPDPQLRARLFGETRERKRWIREKIWSRLPLFVRPYLLFAYSYVLKLGFLDGRAGLVYHTLHAFWFRFLIDAKIEEKKHR